MTNSAARKINKPSRFSVMAKRPGGVSPDQAIAKAAASIDKLKSKYLEWVARDIGSLERMIEEIHASKGTDAAKYEAAYVKAGQIRDLGATFDFPLTTEVADRLCELLHRLKNAELYSADALRTHFGALQLVCTEAFRGKTVADQKPLLDGLNQVIAKYPEVETTPNPAP